MLKLRRKRVPRKLLFAVIPAALAGLAIALGQKTSNQARSGASTSPPSPVHPASPEPLATAKAVADPNPLSKEELAKQQWFRVLPALKQADQQRLEALVENIQQFHDQSAALVTQDGIDAFIDEALSLKSKALVIKDRGAHRRWLRDLFTTYVFPIQRFKELLSTSSASLDAKLNEINSETLIAIQADVQLDPAALEIEPIDLALIEDHLDHHIVKVQEAVDDSMGRSVASFFFGAAGFEAGRQLTRHAMSDDSGNVTLLGELFSMGAGLIVEEVTRHASDELLQVRQTIASDLKTATSYLIRHSTTEGPIQEERIDAASRHTVALFLAITQFLGVDPEWAYVHTYRESH